LRSCMKGLTVSKILASGKHAVAGGDGLLLEMLQGTPIPTFVIDADHVITLWNKACEHVTGFAASEMVGSQRQWEPFYGTERPMMADMILRGAPQEEVSLLYGDCWCCSPLIEGAYEAEGFFPGIGEGGTWFFFTAAPLRDAIGNIVGVIETLQNISERKKAEKELVAYHEGLEKLVLQRTSELTAVNEELSQYAFVVSHDLRSPLRAIRNYSDFLQEELCNVLNDEQREYFGGLGRALRQGEDLVNDLLDLSRIGRKKVDPQRIETGRFLRELVEGLHLPSDVELLMGDGWPDLAADRTLMEQIFRNLITNAVKFSQSQPKKVELGWLASGEGEVELFVRDNGIGIDPRYHEQIFRMLQRLHNQKEFEGTGIGLAIVRKAVGKMNGTVRLESQPGEGSAFYVKLPCWIPQEQ
jgi:two-component system NtrC family sensor kinase